MMSQTFRSEVQTLRARTRTIIEVWPAAAAIAYPFLLEAFHAQVSPPGGVMSGFRIAAAILVLSLAFAVPLSGLASAYLQTRVAQPSQANVRRRRLAYASVATPPLFVFVGVLSGLLGSGISDVTIWIAIWSIGACYVWSGNGHSPMEVTARPTSASRVAHGVTGALITIFIVFHLTNHLFGLAGPVTHATVMKAGRTVYRSWLVEPVLVAVMLFQVGSGVRLAWMWGNTRTDAYRVFQIASGAYLSAFILTHMNSALVSARLLHKIDTNWAWASGAPVGLIHDPWSIRLLPHYALGVFFIIGHLASGLRVVMLAHGVAARNANIIWIIGLLTAAATSAAIVAALCGLRV